MAELNIVEFGDGEWVNLRWVMSSAARHKFDEDNGEEYWDITFRFADGRGSQEHVRVDQSGLDAIREAMI
jgi:hypothetical protein